jgi:hypothetical protein
MPINPVALELFFHCISRSHGLAVASVVEVVVVESLHAFLDMQAQCLDSAVTLGHRRPVQLGDTVQGNETDHGQSSRRCSRRLHISDLRHARLDAGLVVDQASRSACVMIVSGAGVPHARPQAW